MIIYEDTFTTRLGTDFKFAFDFKDGGFEIHIIEQPGYGDRSDDLHLTHRQTTGNGFKVCWDTKLTHLGDARQIAAKWAVLTEKYILDGTPFPA